MAKTLTNEETKTGYILWEPTSEKAPVVVFADRPAAIRAAHSMASNNHGKRFYVVKIVGVATVPKIVYEDLDQ